VMKLQNPRRGDSADMSYIEYVDRSGELRRPRPPNPKGSLLLAMMEKVGKMNVSEADIEAAKAEAAAEAERKRVKKENTPKKFIPDVRLAGMKMDADKLVDGKPAAPKGDAKKPAGDAKKKAKA
jgi:hypothetical protein